MNFFERQRAARGTTLRLVVLFVIAVVSIVAINDIVVLILVRNGPASTIVGAIVAMSVFTLLSSAAGPRASSSHCGPGERRSPSRSARWPSTRRPPIRGCGAS